MRPKVKKICAEPGCGDTFEYDPRAAHQDRVVGQYCVEHRQSHADRRVVNPVTNSRRQSLYHSRRWKITRKVVFDRDGYQCVLCGATELESPLVCDHIGGIDYDDPFNPDLCRTLCLSCSGRVDGARGSIPRHYGGHPTVRAEGEHPAS